MAMGSQAMDVERQTPTENNNMGARFCWVSSLLPVSVAILVCMILLTEYYRVNPHYYVAIDSASVLDPKTGVSFNLTLGVASRSHGANACIDHGMYMEVFYRGIQVAASDGAETRRTCARPRNVAELPIVARATRVPVLDNLAGELGQGAAVFDLRLHFPTWSYMYRGQSCIESWVWDCKGSRVGDAAVPCGFSGHTRACTM